MSPAAAHITVGGIRLGFQESGQGGPVLFLHGFGGRASNWEPQMLALAGRWRALALDLRGFGRSDRTPGSLALADYAGDVAGALDALGIERCAVVGLSMGGMVAQHLALDHPERVAALALAGATCRLPERTRAFNDALARTALERGAGAVADAIIPGCFTARSIERGRACVRAFHRSVRETHPETLAQALRAICGLDTCGRLGAIRVPTLVLCGEHDPTRPQSEHLRERIAGSRLEIIPGAGHVANLEQPERFTEALRVFLSETGTRDGQRPRRREQA